MLTNRRYFAAFTYVDDYSATGTAEHQYQVEVSSTVQHPMLPTGWQGFYRHFWSRGGNVCTPQLRFGLFFFLFSSPGSGNSFLLLSFTRCAIPSVFPSAITSGSCSMVGSKLSRVAWNTCMSGFTDVWSSTGIYTILIAWKPSQTSRNIWRVQYQCYLRRNAGRHVAK